MADSGENLGRIVKDVWLTLGDGPPSPNEDQFTWTGPRELLASPLPVATLAAVSVAACTAAGTFARRAAGYPDAQHEDEFAIDTGAVATAFVSEGVLRRDGQRFEGFAPLSSFWPASDGWVRTHANYPHHRARLLSVLGVERDEDVGPSIAERSAFELEDAAAAAGALIVAVRTPEAWLAHPQGRAIAGRPWMTLRRATPGPRVPVPRRPRVLDLTRVIAGPVATRTLALLGADVLRVDSPRLPEIEAQHLDTGFGKRSTLLDLERADDLARFHELLGAADVLVTGYRPGAFERFGLGEAELGERYPSLVVGRLSAWGAFGPWENRRGFDSLVQAVTGIADTCAGPDGHPGALPAQALDHGTGYLLATAVLRGLQCRAEDGGGYHAELSLAQTSHWLQHMLTVDTAAEEPPPSSTDAVSLIDVAAEHSASMGELTYALPPVSVPGAPTTWAHPPHPWGSDPAEWPPL